MLRGSARVVVALPLGCLLVAPLAPPAAADAPDVTVTAVLRDADGDLRFVSRTAPSASDGAQLAERWDDRAGVLAAEVDGTVRALSTGTTDTYRHLQWGLDRLEAEQTWPGGNGTGAVVAVLDTGVDGAHVDLRGQLLPQIDLVEPSATRTVGIDPQGHGTHVAGVVAATTGNGLGVAGYAPGARVLPVRVLRADGSGSDATVAKGITRAVEAGAHVINLSLGGDRPSSVLQVAVDDAVRRGVVVVAAAGNSGPGGAVEYPAGFDGVLGVAATTRTDAVTGFSTPGRHVDLAAPGQDVLSTYPGDRLAEFDGTSMAAPFVAGAAALLISSGVPRAQVAQRLVATAQDLGPAGRDDATGAGLVDVRSARGQRPTATTAGPATTAPPSTQTAPSPAPEPAPVQSEPTAAAPSPAPSSPLPSSPTPEPTAAPTPAPTSAAPPASSESPAAPPEADPSPSSAPSAAPTATSPTGPAVPARSATPAPSYGARVSSSARTVTAGGAVTVSARALRDGRGTAGLPVRLERSTGSGWTTVRTGTSGEGGLLSWSLRPDRSGTHRVRVGDAVSAPAPVDVRQRLVVSATRSGVSGSVGPAGRASLVVERRTATGWVRVARVSSAADGRWRAAVRLSPGTVVRAAAAARPGLLAGTATARVR